MGWFGGEDKNQVSKSEQEVKINGNNNKVELHADHVQLIHEIKITLITITSILILIVLAYVLRKIYKVYKKNSEKKSARKLRKLKLMLSKEVLNNENEC